VRPPFTLRLLALALAALLALACVPFVPSASAQSGADEQAVKAAFLYKFGSYVQWPDSAFARPDSPVVIAVAGADDIYDRLVRIAAGRSIAGRPIAVRRLQKGERLTGIHILFVGSGAKQWLNELVARIGRRPILLVTEEESGMPDGSVINFKLIEDRVRFDVSLMAAEASGLKLSALLLSVARQVRGRPS
jgi:hypothetical protein